MKLLRCHVENFGVLSNFDRDFTDGLNVLCRENGFGKSTLAAFIKAMFYGLPRTRTKNNARKHYDPWQGGKYGGFLEFEYRGTQYRVTRYFGKKEDTFSLTDLTNRAESTAFSQKLGEEMFHLDEDSFARSTFVPQFSPREMAATTSIRAKLTNLVEDTNDLNNFDTAMKQLQEYRKGLKLFKGEGGQIAQLRAESRSLEASICAAAEKEEPLETVCQQIDQLNREKTEKEKEMETLRQQIRQASGQKALQLQQESLEQLRQQVRERAENLEKLDAQYPTGYPTLAELDAQQENMTRALGAQKRIEGRAAAEGAAPLLSEEEQKRLETLEQLFRQGAPREEELEDWEEKRQERDILLRSRESGGLSAQEQADLQALRRTFAKGVPQDAQIRQAQRQGRQIAELQGMQRTGAERSEKKSSPPLWIFGPVLLALGLVLLVLKQTVPGAVSLVLGLGVLLWALLRSKRADSAVSAGIAQAEETLADLQRQRDGFLLQYFADAAEPEEKLGQLLADRQRYLDLSARDSEWEAQCRQTEEKLRQIQSSLQLAFERFYPGECYDDGFLKKLRDGLADFAQLNRRIQEEKARRAAEDAQDRREAAEALGAVREFLDRYGLSGQTVSQCIQKAEADVHNRKNLCEELEKAQRALNLFLEKNGDVGPLQQSSLPGAEELEAREKQVQDRLNALDRELQEARVRRRALRESVEQIPQWEDRKDALEEELREAERKCDLTDRTMALLEKAKDALANSYVEKMEQGFRKYADELLPGQLGNVMVDKDLQPHIDAQGAARELESFSAGTADGILLCMRLALVDALFGAETPFLILDDPFVNLDDEHTKYALALLKAMAGEHQILYLVCNSSRV